MAQDWADNITQKLLDKSIIKKGICLFLGASDTGKTTLAAAMLKRLASKQPVGIVDADIGQSHIGPPTTVGWAVADSHHSDFSRLSAAGISFVGDVTPVGHLLQLTAATIQCVEQASKVAELIIIDTPGFIRGPAASALWWTVQRVLSPKLIIAVQRENELSDILAGLPHSGTNLELVRCPSQIRTKSPEERRQYRQEQFDKYFRDSHFYNINLSDIAVQTTQNLNHNSPICRLVGLRNKEGIDLAIDIIKDWRSDKKIAVIVAAQLDIKQVCCLVIGNVSIEITST